MGRKTQCFTRPCLWRLQHIFSLRVVYHNALVSAEHDMALYLLAYLTGQLAKLQAAVLH